MYVRTEMLAVPVRLVEVVGAEDMLVVEEGGV